MGRIYSEEETKKISESFLLDQEQLDETVELIYQFLIRDKQVKENPIAVVVGGQSGAGKTGAIGYALKSLQDDAIVVDNDTYREFHPRVQDINFKYPELFTECTDQLSFYATPKIIEKLIAGKYNLVIHQTLKNNRIADDAMKKLIDAGYIVGVMCLAVSDVESNLSMIQRSVSQQMIDGTCRWVPQPNHDYAYKGVPDTIEYIENGCKNYNFIEILMRGIEDISSPRVIYKKNNPYNTELANETIQQYFNSVPEGNFESAKQAVIGGREKSLAEVCVNIDSVIKQLYKNDESICGSAPSEAKTRLSRLQKMVEDLREADNSKKSSSNS